MAGAIEKHDEKVRKFSGKQATNLFDVRKLNIYVCIATYTLVQVTHVQRV